MNSILFEQKLIDIPLLGPKRIILLNKQGIFTIKDLLLFFPYKYLTLDSNISEKELFLEVEVVYKKKYSDKFFQVCVKADNKNIFINLFNIKLFSLYKVGCKYKVLGVFYIKNNCYNVDSPNIISSKSTTVSLYKGISSSIASKAINYIISKLNDDDRVIFNNLSIKDALINIHSGINVKKSIEVFKFLEACCLTDLFKNHIYGENLTLNLQDVLTSLPYKLSSYQLELVEKIKDKLSSNLAMNYFVYGEVGSGKTLISLTSALMMVKAGYNVVFLAPTVALAHQHFEYIQSIANNIGVQCFLLVSKMKKKNKAKSEIQMASSSIIIGTHSLIHLDNIPNIGLVIIDEMQKFGVLQRNNLLNKAVRKNLLLLSATPIPRSLGMMLKKIVSYDKLPSYKVKKIDTLWLKSSEIESLLSKLLLKKVYWVLPSIEEGEKSIGVISRYEFLKAYFSDIWLLHGKMKDEEKLDSINNFKSSKSGLLVSTTVIEIGINVPDADIIIIENANQFGLSQLHQLRGRVGRSGQQSYCILISDFLSKKIKYMKEYDNGFDISSKDLELRGEGRITGVQQYGDYGFFFLDHDDDYFIELASEVFEKYRDYFYFFIG